MQPFTAPKKEPVKVGGRALKSLDKAEQTLRKRLALRKVKPQHVVGEF